MVLRGLGRVFLLRGLVGKPLVLRKRVPIAVGIVSVRRGDLKIQEDVGLRIGVGEADVVLLEDHKART